MERDAAKDAFTSRTNKIASCQVEREQARGKRELEEHEENKSYADRAEKFNPDRTLTKFSLSINLVFLLVKTIKVNELETKCHSGVAFMRIPGILNDLMDCQSFRYFIC